MAAMQSILPFCLTLLLLNQSCGLVNERKDLAILLDSSKSINDEIYECNLDFMSELVNFMSISPGTTRLALITFTSKARLEFSFEKYVNRECLQKKFASLRKRRRKGRTNIDAGLRKAIDLFKNHKGFATDRELYVISDGKWNEGRSPKQSLSKLRKLGIKVKAFGIGRNPNKRNLKYIVGKLCKSCYVRLDANCEKHNRLMRFLTKRKEPVTACKGQGIVRDECHRECSCINGRMVDCFRIRREFTTYSKEEKKRYLQAYYKITTEEPLKSRFIKFISIHANWFWKGIHGKYQFFPWHRWFIYEFENLMKEADCRVGLPFWDWSYWSEIPWKIGVHIWRNDEFGLGGDGIKSREYCVQTGPFNESAWRHPAPEKTLQVIQTSDTALGICNGTNYTGPYKSCLRRSFNYLPANLAFILETISLPCNKYRKFEKSVREDFHNDIHNEIGGEMSTDYAANSPEFFFHHGFLDNIWWRWQKKSVKCKYAQFGKTSRKLLNSRFETKDFMDSSYQGECVKVKYDDFLARVLKPGQDVGKARAATIPVETCPENDVGSSAHFVRQSAFSLLKDEMRRERERERERETLDD